MTSTLGLSPEDHLTVRWRWLPVAPPAVTTPLPPRSHRDAAAFHAAAPPESEWAPFRFSFPQLAKQTPDLRFYRLIQQFNTPLLSLTTRAAGQSGFALWRGAFPSFRDDFRWAHFWFFRDGADGDRVAVEYGFDGALTLYSETKSDGDLSERYRVIVARLGSL